MRKQIRIYVFFLVLSIVFGSGIFLGQYLTVKNNSTVATSNAISQSDVNFDIFWQGWDFIEKNFVTQPISKKELFQGAMAGSVAALRDPYSVYFDPETAKKFSQELSGAFEGIGAEIGLKNQILTIIAPLADSPADQAGLRAGDWILAIDGTDTSTMNLDSAVSRIRGASGTPVTLLIVSPGQGEIPRDVVITRQTITVHSVKKQILDGNIAYIELMNFNSQSDNEFSSTVGDIIKNNPQGIILDLRNNPGGFLDDAIDVASFWVKNGELVASERFSNGKTNEYRARGQALLSHIPTVVLINEGSASGSEIVAAAIKEHSLATIVGKTSFGKGSVQEVQEFSDGSAIKLTVAKWLTPDGNELEGVGVTPDVAVELSKEDYDNNRDPQLDAAIQLIKEK